MKRQKARALVSSVTASLTACVTPSSVVDIATASSVYDRWRKVEMGVLLEMDLLNITAERKIPPGILF